MEKILFFLLFLTPFIIFPLGVSPFESIKVFVVEIGIIVLLLLYIAKNPVLSIFHSKYTVHYVLIILSVLHLFLSPSTFVLFGNEFRLFGTFLFILLLLFSIISSKLPLKIPSPIVLTGLLSLHLIGAVFIEGKLDMRAIGTLGEANSLASNTIFLLPFLLVGNMSKRSWVRVVGVFLAGGIILFTGSRSGVIALLLMCIFYLLQRYSLKAAVVVCSLLFTVSLSLPFFQQNQLFENRATIWETAVTAGFARPILGWGVGNTEIALKVTAREMSNVLRYEYVDHTHNIFLEMWVQTGIIGVVVFSFIVIKSIFQFYRKKQLLELSLLLGLLTMLSFNPLSIVILLQFWHVVGRGSSNNELSQ